jgi:FkbM family methyltransferase
MISAGGWVFPDGETHLPAQLARWNIAVDGRLTYQYPIYQRAVAACRVQRVAVDVGAHVGLWSYWMVRDFAQVVAFEPVAQHRACWLANIPQRPQDSLYPCALGSSVGLMGLTQLKSGSSGGTCVSGPGVTPVDTLDAYQLELVDFLKIDCEGAELDVLAGAVDTVTRCRPVVAVEQRPTRTRLFQHGRTDAVAFLQRLGASVRWTDGHDYVMAFT